MNAYEFIQTIVRMKTADEMANESGDDWESTLSDLIVEGRKLLLTLGYDVPGARHHLEDDIAYFIVCNKSTMEELAEDIKKATGQVVDPKSADLLATLTDADVAKVHGHLKQGIDRALKARAATPRAVVRAARQIILEETGEHRFPTGDDLYLYKGGPVHNWEDFGPPDDEERPENFTILRVAQSDFEGVAEERETAVADRAAALKDLLASLDVTDDSSDSGESYMVMGNVDTKTLVALGMREGACEGCDATDKVVKRRENGQVLCRDCYANFKRVAAQVQQPKAREPRFIVINETDGIPAAPQPMTKAEAEKFIKSLRDRYWEQGYYKTASGQRISPNDVQFTIAPAPFESETQLTLQDAVELLKAQGLEASRQVQQADVAVVALASRVSKQFGIPLIEIRCSGDLQGTYLHDYNLRKLIVVAGGDSGDGGFVDIVEGNTPGLNLALMRLKAGETHAEGGGAFALLEYRRIS